MAPALKYSVGADPYDSVSITSTLPPLLNHAPECVPPASTRTTTPLNKVSDADGAVVKLFIELVVKISTIPGASAGPDPDGVSVVNTTTPSTPIVNPTLTGT